MCIKNIFAAVVALSLGGAATQAATSIVYSNATTYSGSFLNPGLTEIGDEINLGAGPRFGSSFRFEYFGAGFSGNEQFEIRFYQNNGAPIGNGAFLPNTLFYDSGPLQLLQPTDPSGRATYLIDLTLAPLPSAPLPDRFTWSIQFSGTTGAGEAAGVSLYDPATVGFSEADFWEHAGSTWQLRGTNPINFNFGSALVATTVPEPSTYMLAIIGGLCGLALVHRRARKT